MAAFGNVGAAGSGSSCRRASTGNRARTSKTVSGSNNNYNEADLNSSETRSLSSSMTSTSSGGSEGGVGAASSSVPSGGLRRSGGGAGCGGKGKKRFVGVRQRPSGRWVAEIKDTTQKIRLWLGTFDTSEDAARAYDEAACLLRGANTRTNFMPCTTRTNVPALPSKAARLLQLGRNAAAKSASNSPSVNTKKPTSSCRQDQQQNGTQSTGREKSGNVSKSDPNAALSNSSQAHVNSKPTSVLPLKTETIVAVPSKAEAVEELSGTVSSSESESFDSLDRTVVKVMDGFEQSPAPGYNATSSPTRCLTNYSDDQILFVGSDDSGSRRSEVIVKQEIIPGEYCDRPRESGAIRENRKENDYCIEAPQESFLEDTEMSSGLSCLDDVDLSCDDSVYSSPPFDFSADMGSIDFESLIPCGSPSSDDDSTYFSEQLRRLSYERQVSAGLYAIGGVQEYLSLSNGTSSFGMSSPSLTLAAGFRRSTSGPFQSASSPTIWKSPNASSNGSTWGTNGSNSSSTPTGNGSGESLECPREDALWQSWDLSPLCVVA